MSTMQGKNILIVGDVGGMGSALSKMIDELGVYNSLYFHKTELDIQLKKVKILSVDVTRRDLVDEMFEEFEKNIGIPDCVIYLSNIQTVKLFLDITMEEYEQTMSVELEGAFHCAQIAAQRMIKHKVT